MSDFVRAKCRDDLRTRTALLGDVSNQAIEHAKKAIGLEFLVDKGRKFTINDFGPCRVVGLQCRCDGQGNEIARVWKDFCARSGEIRRSEQSAGFGICSWFEDGGTDTFEYVAAVSVDKEVPVPQGMISIDIPRYEYAIFVVPSVSAVSNVWRSSLETIESWRDWEFHKESLMPAGVRFAFEYYPPSYRGDGEFFIYIPVKKHWMPIE